jgi:hypothetical protein
MTSHSRLDSRLRGNDALLRCGNDAFLVGASRGIVVEGNQALLKSDARPVMLGEFCLRRHDTFGVKTSVGSFYGKTA